MDEEALVALYQQLVANGATDEDAAAALKLHVGRQRMAARQPEFARQEVAEAQPDFSGKTGALFAALLKAGQGASFGLTDELSGDPEAARMALAAAQKQQPVVSTVADIGGSMLIPLPGGGVAGNLAKVAKGAVKTKALKSGLKAGALLGGTFGAGDAFGRSEGSVTERLPATAVGAGIGVGLGTAFPLLSTIARETSVRTPVLGGAIRAVKAVGKALQREAPVAADPLEAVAKFDLVESVAENLKKLGHTPEQVERVLTVGKSPIKGLSLDAFKTVQQQTQRLLDAGAKPKDIIKAIEGQLGRELSDVERGSLPGFTVYGGNPQRSRPGL